MARARHREMVDIYSGGPSLLPDAPLVHKRSNDDLGWRRPKRKMSPARLPDDLRDVLRDIYRRGTSFFAQGGGGRRARRHPWRHARSADGYRALRREAEAPCVRSCAGWRRRLRDGLDAEPLGVRAWDLAHQILNHG